MVFSHFTRPIWLFFDLDDTLWDFSRNSLESLHNVFEKFKEINSRFPSFNDFLTLYRLHNSVLWKDFAEGKISSESLKSERWRLTLFPDSDPAATPEICRAIDKEYLRCLACQPHVIDGAFPMLEALSKDYMIAVLSNGFIDTQYLKLKYSGLWKYIARAVVSDEAGYQKPDPRLYEYAVNATGAIGTPVMIGDNPDTDILGALLAGWKTIWLNPCGNRLPLCRGVDPENFLGSAPDLKEVEKIIRSM
ncbi:MAG: noncanonical pyrimidine nucleotidase, YjjG family [Bacteroides sp.]|nr:noncanonical pyrimidine nucleotidase, YjjG family [Bacteroides sp.]